MKQTVTTHEVIDIMFPEHGSSFSGTEQECLDFISRQPSSYGYKSRPIPKSKLDSEWYKIHIS